MDWMRWNDCATTRGRRAGVMFDALGTTTTEDVRRAYEAKRTCDAVRARAGECADAARGAVAHAFARGASAVASTNAMTNDATTSAMSAMQAMRATNATKASAGRGERRWTCHACEKLEGGGRGKMVEGVVVQPAGMPVVLLEVRGEVMDRTALPMGKDVLVKGEMITVGKWLARVVGVEGAAPEPPRVLARPTVEDGSEARGEVEKRVESAAASAVAGVAAVGATTVAEAASRAQPLLVTTPTLATQPRAGGLEAPGTRKEYFHDTNAPSVPPAASHQHAPMHASPKYQIYEPAPRYDRAVDPNTGERERWMAGGWRGRAGGDERPRGVTQQEVDEARSRLLELERDARIRAEVAAAEALARQQQAEAARLSAESALQQMSQAEAANQAVREAEYAAAEAKRVAYVAAQNQLDAESQFISMLPLDNAETSIEAHRRVSELEDIQRRIAEHERAAEEHTLRPDDRKTPASPQQQAYAPPQQAQYQPPSPPRQQYQSPPPPQPVQQYQPPPQQPAQQYQQPAQQYQPPPQQPAQQYQQPQQQQYQPPPQQPAQYQQPPPQPVVQAHQQPPPQPQPQSPPSQPQRAQAEIEYTSSPSNVRDRAAAFGRVTIKPKPASHAVDARAQTYSNTGTSMTNANAHALAQVIRQERPARPATAEPKAEEVVSQGKAETSEEIKRKIDILERLAKSRGLIA